ncbi:hypothetical protein EDB83DRAFT_2314902 [Lactarius deliciosus]|nr:hypothetical protein EDB83DRAFT_2314902 [Lactarius deliciosus]
MAGKRLGRLRQWADEVINTKDKATLTGEAKELEQEIEVRKEGLQRSISKKKLSIALDDPDKVLPRDAFGVTMVRHGEDFADDSLLGTSPFISPFVCFVLSATGQALVKFGRAFCNVATAQEALGRSLGSTFIIALQRFLDQVKDYEVERKKLETRRLNKDAAMKQVERLESNKKTKEKDLREAQEELEKSEFRYDEAEADVQARIEAIQQNEIDQIRELGSLLDNELNYAEQYAQILRDVKNNWPGKAESPKPKIRSRASSKARPRSRSPSQGDSDSEAENEPPQPRSRKGSVRSRAGSVRSRKRSDSQTTTGSTVEAAREKKDKEEKKKGSWSMWGRNGSKKDREQFAALRDGADEDSDSSDPEGAPGASAQSLKSTSLLSLGKWSKPQQNPSPRIPPLGSRARSGELERQVVRAVSDYLGSADELSFNTGDEIVVIGEVIDGWMMGQLGGKKGLFPTVYTEPITAGSRRVTPYAISCASAASKEVVVERKLRYTEAPALPRFGVRTERVQTANTQEDDASHPFGDHHATTHDTDTEHEREREQQPEALASAALGGGFGYGYDSESLAESAADESEQESSHLVRRRASDDDGFVNYQFNNNGSSTNTSTSTGSGPQKKVPPPLPRRQTDVRKAPPPPPPPRRPDIRASPQPPSYGLRDGQTGDCMNFVQAVGRTTGMCANCQRMHID